MSASSKLWGWIHEPLPVLRLELMRIAAPLAILGFMSSRLDTRTSGSASAASTCRTSGGTGASRSDVPPLPDALAWGLAVVMVVSGLACAAGFWTRRSGLVFAATLAFVAVDDRLAAFTVSKMSPVVTSRLRSARPARASASTRGESRTRRASGRSASVRWRASASSSSFPSSSTARRASQRRTGTG